ncbi:MAG TPA: MXAN_5808 family serine peptidase, partial [Candidatus Hypogeohydataceae bacterium YC41]
MFHYTEKFRKGVLSVFFALLIPFLLIFLTLPESGQALFLDWYTGEKAPKYLLTGTVCSYVDRFYVEQERIHSQHMLVEGLQGLERLLPEVQVEPNETQGTLDITVGEGKKRLDMSKVQSLDDTLTLIKEGLFFIQNNLEDTSKASEIEYAAINGMLSDLDPHSVLFPPKEYKEFMIGTSGRFGGLGMVVGMKDMTLTVISPIEGTPAYRAGLKAGDKILEIDGESTVNMSLQEAVSKLRGEPGTKVTIYVVAGKAAEPKMVTLKREMISLPSVESQLLEGNIGYIKIRSFQEDTVEDLDKNIQQLQKASTGLRGVILDMRNNSGGLLDQAVGVSDRFLEEGIIVVTVGPGKRQRDVQRARYSEKDLTFCPMITIIDSGSASGSEIVAAALKENERALVIGDRSFGKGSVQQLYELSGTSALKLTVAKYLTPLYRDIQTLGVTPDVNLVPVILGKENIVLEKGTAGVLREEDLRGHLHGEVTPPEPALVTLKYLAAQVETPEVEEETLYQQKDLSKDKQVQIALELVKATTVHAREEMLNDLWPHFQTLRNTEEGKIIKALAELGIDWSTGKDTKTPKPVASFTFQPWKEKWNAGETVNVTLTVHNQGEGSLYRMYGITESKDPLMDKLEFPLGKIEGGSSKSYTQKIELPKNMFDRADGFTVKFSELNGNSPKDITNTLTVEALPRPEFAFSYQIVEANTEGRRPDDDGLVQKGELLNLLVTVRNIGKGASSKNMVTIRNLSQKEVFIEEGSKELGELAPEEEKTVRLRFLVKEALEAKEFSMDLVVTDLNFGVYLTQKLTFPVMASRVSPPVVEVAKYVQSTRPTFVYGGRSTESPVMALLKKGSIEKADGWVAGWYRISLPNGGRGWIAATDVTETTVAKEETIALQLQYMPPVIEFERPTLSLPSSRMVLSGSARDDQTVKYLFIIVNNKKVFFKSQKKGEKSREVTFTSEIPLKEGPNTVTIVAR